MGIGSRPSPQKPDHVDGEFRADPLTSLLLELHFNRGLPDRIRERAYELYLQRGEYDGHAMQDWLDAELEILSGR